MHWTQISENTDLKIYISNTEIYLKNKEKQQKEI